MQTSVWQIGEQINIKKFREKCIHKQLYNDADEVFCKISGDSYYSVYSYGVICFHIEDKHEIETLIESLAEYVKYPLEKEHVELFDIRYGQERTDISSDTICLDRSDTEIIQFVFFHLSQTVALDYYMLAAERLLESTERFTCELEDKGHVSLTGRKLKKFIGRSLNLKNRIALNIYAFESPDSIWDDNELNTLDRQFKRLFDIKNRTRNLQDQLEIIKENLDLFKEIMFHRASSFLEWIIIILILVEVVNMILEKF